MFKTYDISHKSIHEIVILQLFTKQLFDHVWQNLIEKYISINSYNKKTHCI